MSRPPLFLIGAPRSGTTLVFKALCAHPETTWIPNWLEKLPAAWPLAGLVRIPSLAPERRYQVWFGRTGENAYSYGSDRRLSDRIFPMPVEGESLFRRCGIIETGSDDDPAPRDQQIQNLRRLFSRLQTWGGRPVVVNKRIENNRRIPLLVEAFPDARFIEIVRDGRAVASSMRNVDWWDRLYLPFHGATVAEWRAEGRNEWEAAARQWVQELEDIDAGRSAAPTENWIRIRYEDLIDEPVATLETLAAHGGLGSRAEWRGIIERLSFPDRNEAWRSTLGGADLKMVESIQADRLAADSYPL